MQYNIFENPVFEAIQVKNKLFPFLSSTRYTVRATGSPVRKQTVYFNKNSLNGLLKALAVKDFKDIKPLEIMQSNSNCYIDVVTSADKKFAAAQIFEYVPFTYQPITELYTMEGAIADNFLSYLEKSKNK